MNHQQRKEQLRGYQQRVEPFEAPLIAAVRAWIERIVANLPLELVIEVFRTFAYQPLLDAIRRVGGPPIDIYPAAAAEAQHILAEIGGRNHLNLRFNLRDPNFNGAVEQLGAHQIVQVAEETKQAVRDIVSQAYQRQLHPFQFAPAIRDAIGLDTRRSVAVVNFMHSQLSNGASQRQAEERAARYAARLRTQRAKTIARTETIRGATLGRLAGFRQALDAGLVPRDRAYLEWNAIQDDPAEICFQLDGRRVPLSEGTFDGLLPPVHPNCLPGDARVAAEGVTACSERLYEGDLVIIGTASGNKLACTPNHPVLTRGGWVAAKSIHVGGHVISRRVGDRERDALNLDDKDVPPRIEDVAEAIRRSQEMTAVPVPLSPEDFHGDGVGSEVAVVWANRLLRDDGESAFQQEPFEFDLVGAAMQAAPLDGGGPLHLRLHRVPRAAYGGVGGGGERGAIRSLHSQHARSGSSARVDAVLAQDAPDRGSADPVLVGEALHGSARHVGGHERLLIDQHALRPRRPALNAAFGEPLVDHDGRDAELARDLLAGAAGEVFADDVVSVDVQSFHGIVYNLETAGGWYTANGIVTHNCRCTVDLIVV